ncbi:MFS transporter [Vineibacter terrae]|uniref:MFS transporter n=1 Tax=Vineibacter terrae TaxID=2586908 RepID=A0A5C8PJC4_9HYPH|nr:MFS transporter [Vineibacter terrae]
MHPRDEALREAVPQRRDHVRLGREVVIESPLGDVGAAAAPTLAVLIAGCAVQGIAGAFLIPGALSILTQAFPDPAQRAHVIGGWSSFTALSLIVGPVLGGVLVDSAGWPSIFLINIPICLLTIGLGSWGIDETANPDQAALDPAGQALSVLWLGALTYGLIAAGQQGWDAYVTMAALAVAAAALALFVIVESRAPRPLLPLALFGHAGFAVTNLASFVLGFSGYSSLFFFSLFLQRAQDWSASATGWCMAPQFAAMTVTAAAFGRLAARHDTRTLMVAGYGATGAALLAMSLVDPDTSYLAIAAVFAVLGVGMGQAVPATSAAILTLAPRERSGMASATMNALRQAGMTLGIALLGTLMSSRATTLLGNALARAGIDAAPEAAAAAVTRHDMTAGIGAGMGADGLEALLAHALAGGFHVAMLCAGALGLIAAALLAGVRGPARRQA